jgi:hypothetical protein
MSMTRLAMAKVHPLLIKYWSGHKVASDIESHYIIPAENEQLQQYIQAYPTALDVNANHVRNEMRTQIVIELLRKLGFDEETINKVKDNVAFLSLEDVLTLAKLAKTQL